MTNTTLSLCHVITYLMSEAQEHTPLFLWDVQCMENIAIIAEIICFVAELIADIRTHSADKSIEVFLLAEPLVYTGIARICSCVLYLWCNQNKVSLGH